MQNKKDNFLLCIIGLDKAAGATCGLQLRAVPSYSALNMAYPCLLMKMRSCREHFSTERPAAS